MAVRTWPLVVGARASFALAFAFASACAPGAAPRGRPAPLVVGSGRAGAPVDPLDAPRARVLAAMDRGDLAEAARALAPLAERDDFPGAKAIARVLASPGRDALFANAEAVKIALPPPPSRAVAPALSLAVKRVKVGRDVREPAERLVNGEYLASGMGEAHLDVADRAPSFAPLRLAEIPIRRYRATDRHWLVTYVDRFVAIANGDDGALVRLLDFGAWPASMHGAAVEWGELRGDVLYFAANTPNGRFLGALDIRDGRILWRSEEGAFSEAFAVGTEQLVAWTYGKPGALVVLDRATGAVRATRPTPEIAGEARLTTEDGMVVAYATSHTMDGKDLEYDERLEIRLPATRPAPAPPMPKAPPTAVRALEVSDRPDVRLAAWGELDRDHDPRAAVIALQPVLAAHPTSFAANVLAASARGALDEARKRATAALEATKPVKIPSAVENPRAAPIARTRARSLRVTARKAITPDTFLAELPRPDESVLLPPATVPERIGNRRRDLDAGSIEGERRVEVYKAPYSTTWIVVWDREQTVAVLETEADVRFANLTGDVLFFATLASGGYLLEARDLRTGDLYYQTPGIHDQAFVIRDGYIVAAAGDQPSVLLIEADTGRIASRLQESVNEPFLVFAKDGAIVAATTSLVLHLALAAAP